VGGLELVTPNKHANDVALPVTWQDAAEPPGRVVVDVLISRGPTPPDGPSIANASASVFSPRRVRFLNPHARKHPFVSWVDIAPKHDRDPAPGLYPPKAGIISDPIRLSARLEGPCLVGRCGRPQKHEQNHADDRAGQTLSHLAHPNDRLVQATTECATTSGARADEQSPGIGDRAEVDVE
jgi:hypothetical protein